MIYGATGYTGELIARAAKARHLAPLLAGRNAETIATLANELNLPHRVFGLDSPESVARQLQDVALVLNCAGPFSATAAPMVSACLQAKTHYLDITGEIAVFEAIHRQDALAKDRGVLLMPGVGFDVVPTDCLALTLKKHLPDADHLILAFSSSGLPSRGTAKTMIEGLKIGGKIRRDGKIISVPLAYRVREIPFVTGPQLAMTIPWGDVSTAYYTTGIPNIEVYLGVREAQVKQMKVMRWLRPLLALNPVQNFMKARVDQRVKGPTEDQRQKAKTVLWGQVSNPEGQSIEMHMITPNGYELTVASALGIVENLLAGKITPGAHTPAGLFGENFAATLPGVSLLPASAR
ncbi:MAG: hypothetical protein D6814_09595, partial [Calditrichaeota bacterium]